MELCPAQMELEEMTAIVRQQEAPRRSPFQPSVVAEVAQFHNNQ